jgi:hypothetical protein
MGVMQLRELLGRARVMLMSWQRVKVLGWVMLRKGNVWMLMRKEGLVLMLLGVVLLLLVWSVRDLDRKRREREREDRRF